MTRTFFVTGVSTGLGRAIAAHALEAGNTVVGTLRNPDEIDDFEVLASGRAHGRILDVTDTDAIAPLVTEVEANVGPIDVLVNNAGYGVEGTLEESGLDVLRRQFEVNVYGAVAITQAALPGMRARRRGHVIFITSMGGLRTFPGLAFYHGSKYAVEGIAATLRQEVAHLGIAVTAVEPGSFRTDWAGRSMHRVERSISDYDEVFDAARARRLEMNGRQLGDPDKAADALLRVVDAPHPPGHLLLGTDALRLVAEAREAFDAETREWAELSATTDFTDGLQL